MDDRKVETQSAVLKQHHATSAETNKRAKNPEKSTSEESKGNKDMDWFDFDKSLMHLKDQLILLRALNGLYEQLNYGGKQEISSIHQINTLLIYWVLIAKK